MKLSKSVVLGFLIAGILVFSGSIFIFREAVYKGKVHGAWVEKVVSYVPFMPALTFDGEEYSYKEYLSDLNDLQAYLDKNADGNLTDDIKKGVLLNAATNLVIEKLAKKYNITLSDADYDDALKNIVGGELNDENMKPFKEWLHDTYNWDLEKYKDKVIKYMILTEKISQHVVDDQDFSKNVDAKKKIDEAKKKIDDGADFADVAKEYSEDASASNGGDLDWFSLDMMVPEFSDKLKTMKKGEVSGVFSSRFGYHIVKLIDTRKNEDSGKDEYHAAHIIVMGESLNDVLDNELKNGNLEVYVNGFTAEDILSMMQVTQQ